MALCIKAILVKGKDKAMAARACLMGVAMMESFKKMCIVVEGK
jgi:hypothetical protein